MSGDLILSLKRALTVKPKPEQAIASPAMPKTQDRARPAIRAPVASGLITLLMFFGGFGAWAGLAPLSSAAIAPGAVRVEDYRKTVQHLEGGIIRALNVRDGDRVKQGERLIALDKTQAQARYKAQLAQVLTLKAEQARLTAERDARSRIDFPPSLLACARHHAQVAERLKGQRRIFQSRRRTLKGRIEILHQRIAQLRLQAQGLRPRLTPRRASWP
jgi:HlyD family type I secretion membrane fusion protein